MRSREVEDGLQRTQDGRQGGKMRSTARDTWSPNMSVGIQFSRKHKMRTEFLIFMVFRAHPRTLHPQQHATRPSTPRPCAPPTIPCQSSSANIGKKLTITTATSSLCVSEPRLFFLFHNISSSNYACTSTLNCQMLSRGPPCCSGGGWRGG